MTHGGPLARVGGPRVNVGEVVGGGARRALEVIQVDMVGEVGDLAQGQVVEAAEAPDGAPGREASEVHDLVLRPRVLFGLPERPAPVRRRRRLLQALASLVLAVLRLVVEGLTQDSAPVVHSSKGWKGVLGTVTDTGRGPVQNGILTCEFK